MFEISSSPVRAVIVTQALMSVPALVMKIFEPLITQLPLTQLGARPRRTCVRARARLREPERGEPAAGREVGEPALSLLVGAEEQDRHRPERGVRCHGDRNGRVDPGQLLDRDRVREGVAAGAAPYSSGIGMPISPSSASSADDLVGEAVLAIELLGDRCDALDRELADRLPNQLVLVGEVEVHRAARRVASSTMSRTP